MHTTNTKVRALRAVLGVVAAATAGFVVFTLAANGSPADQPASAPADSTTTSTLTRVDESVPPTFAEDPAELSDQERLALHAYGPTDHSCETSETTVSAGSSIQAALDAAAPASTVCVSRGRYRLTEPLRPAEGTTLVFESGATLDGSREVTEWRAEGDVWVATGQTQEFEPMDVPCQANPAACEYEDLFWDGFPLTRVLNRSELTSGTFYFDESADTIFVADDPNGHLVEATVAGTAIDAGGIQGVTVQNATIEKFGLHGIVTSSGWVVANNEIRYVHSHGVRAFGNTRVVGNYIHHAGNMGIFGQGDALVFDGNQLAYNNYLNFDLWHAGATKIVRSPNTIVTNNWSHHNNGDGWWFDWDNANPVVANNLFEHNSRFGFFIEASFGATIHDNLFYRNGDTTQDETGAGLWISTSKDIEIRNNVFEDNVKTLILVTSDRGTSEQYGKRQTTGMYAHDNVFILDQGYLGVAYGDSSVYAQSSDNRFANNQYIVPNINSDWWRWGSPHNWSEWNAAGQDTTSTITTP